jgi:uncharacterized membrane protein
MQKDSVTKKEIQEGKIFALMSYLSVLCIIPLVFKKDNRFVLFHAKQGLVIFIAEVAFFILSIIIKLKTIGILFFGILSLWGITQTLSGKYTKIPIISDIAEKISL